MSNADIFIDKYKQLEETVRITYGLQDNDSISYYLTKQKQYQKFKDEIKYCQDVRNLLSHKKKLNDRYAVEPNEHMLELIDSLIEKIKNRTRCSDIQIPKKNIFWQPFDGNVKNTMKIMRENLYTHIPILENGIVKGVFDENSIFNYLSNEEIIEISDELTFNDIKPYLILNDREMESFIFFSSNGYVEDLEKVIEAYFRKGKRVGIAFITSTGKETENLQGIITPWDIIASAD